MNEEKPFCKPCRRKFNTPRGLHQHNYAKHKKEDTKNSPASVATSGKVPASRSFNKTAVRSNNRKHSPNTNQRPKKPRKQAARKPLRTLEDLQTDRDREEADLKGLILKYETLLKDREEILSKVAEKVDQINEEEEEVIFKKFLSEKKGLEVLIIKKERILNNIVREQDEYREWNNTVEKVCTNCKHCTFYEETSAEDDACLHCKCGLLFHLEDADDADNDEYDDEDYRAEYGEYDD
eukprot:TRINITY_DN18036_c0_g1_i1.p1 TRINITY_DN18036_c0_g1~~TRINITY_DN18036_c0_g1_i1.p1  ORF type:complete len:237 (-),score=56.12 TRINITY_DN18036_c0_g1_i1:41-751(-)